MKYRPKVVTTSSINRWNGIFLIALSYMARSGVLSGVILAVRGIKNMEDLAEKRFDMRDIDDKLMCSVSRCK